MRKLFHPKTSYFLKIIYHTLIWERYRKSKSIFITFDDGPTPGVTDKALDILNSYGAKGTFFCKGANVQKHPLLYQRIINEGHDVGNHTFNHLKGWTTKNNIYFDDIENARKLIDSTLFRPPYGKITYSQIRHLKKNYNIIMWDVMSFDYDQSITPEECANNVISNVEPGSIITFHDSIPASKNMLYALRVLLEFSKDRFISSIKLSEEFNNFNKTGT